MADLLPAARLADCRLYLCTADRDDLEEFTAACIFGGVDIAQLRDKQLDARSIVDRAQKMQSVCTELNVPFVLNDRPDLALYIGADGVHVGQDDAPPELARRIVGPHAIVGFSTHQPSEIAAAMNEPCDYVSAGPVVPTPTKPGRPGTGIGYIEQAAQVTTTAMPFFVTGGVTPETVGALIDAGATRFVVVRYLTESSDPQSSARRLRQAIDEGLERRSALQREIAQ